MINFYMGGIRQGNMLSLMHDGYLHVCRDAQASGMESVILYYCNVGWMLIVVIITRFSNASAKTMLVALLTGFDSLNQA